MGNKFYAAIVVAVATMALPAVAQATELIAGGSELANSSTVRWASSNLGAQIKNEKKEDTGTLTCTSSELEGKVTANQGESAELSVTKGTLTGCTVSGLIADVTVNASSEKPWTLQIQKPEASGHFTAHLNPAAGSSIQINAQVQLFGSSFATCDYVASAVKFSGQEGSNLVKVEGSEQFEKKSGGSICGQSASLQGEEVLESGGEWVTATRAISPHLCEAKETKCEKEKIYGTGTVIEGSMNETLTFLTGVACSESSFSMETKADVGDPLPATLTALNFSPCVSTVNPKNACTVKALGLNYQVAFYPTLALGNASIFVVIKELEISCANEKAGCKFTFKGLPKMRLEGGTPAIAYAENELLYLVKGGNEKECGATTSWNGTYTVAVPDRLFMSTE